MSDSIPWMGAQADGREDAESINRMAAVKQGKRPLAIRTLEPKFSGSEAKELAAGLPAHQFPVKAAEPERVAARVIPSPEECKSEKLLNAEGAENAEEYGVRQWRDPEGREERFELRRQEELDREERLRPYRGRTQKMLRRYMRYAMEAGRLPSILGSEFFRTRVTSYSVGTFEDRVIFVHDMELCLGRISEDSRRILARYVLQGHDMWETARLLNSSERTVRRMFPMAVDELSEVLLKMGLLEGLSATEQNSCQGGKEDDFSASDCEDGK